MKTARIETLEPRRLLSLTPFGTETIVNPSSPGTANDTDIAVAGNGSYLVASVVHAPVPIGVGATDFSIMAVRYSAAGQPIGAPLVLEKLPPAIDGTQISAAMDGQGDGVVAYTSYNAGAFLVHVVRISSQGVVSTPAVVSSPDPENAPSSPAISMDAQGDYFVGWIQRDPSTQAEVLHIHAYDSTGVSRGPDIQAAAEPTGEGGEGSIAYADFTSLAIAARPDGGSAVFTFTDQPANGLGFAAVGRISVSATIGSLVALADVDPSTAAIPTYAGDVAIHPDGSFVISYKRLDGASQEIPSSHLQRFDATARGLGDAIDPIAGANGGVDAALTLAAMPDGGFATTFANVFKRTSYAYARHYSADGVSLDAAPIQIASFGPREAHIDYPGPRIGADDHGDVVVLYQTSNANIEDFVRYRRLTTDIAAIHQSVLYAFGTKAANSISVTSGNSQVVVHSDGAVRAFDASQIQAMSITGGAGDDRIINDTALPATLDGGSGNDTIKGGTATDAIYGRAGSDRLYGGLGADRIYGNGGRDRLFGGGGDDRLYGGAAGDWLYGQGGNDQLFGEGGNDRLYADYGTGNSTLHGGAGNDLFISTNGRVDQLFGEGGDDTAVADHNDLLNSVETSR